MSDSRIRAYFVSDPGGNYLPGEYTSMSEAQGEADELNESLEHEGDFFPNGRHVVGAHLNDGTSTFDIG